MNEIYFYHLVPNNQEGTELIPLNMLKDIHPSVYENAVNKYQGRETILKRKIEVLNCLWNDVVHMTAIDPLTYKQTLKECGLIKASERKQKYYKIPLSILSEDNLCVFYIDERAYNVIDEITEKNMLDMRQIIEPYNIYEMFDESKIDLYGSINILTKKYFKFVSLSPNKIYMMYQFIPHILYKGKISTAGLEVVEL
jgi:hypothetical protein